MAKKELDVEVSDLIFSAAHYGDWTADDFERHLRDVACECGVTLQEAWDEVHEQDRLANEYVDEAHAERQQLGLTSL
ncbi:MAG: hypothetical protein CL581_10965 [Alteromonadaceae bacterium]|nr:hypothetical protein [Alteromonadaceae bacterium]MAA65283.1 hypothetical protein [Alteromonadaceae bacterium]|tara:strand:- start:1004 stop:1234 length:231 start_codon:yes stop_codon:yes gene_type:complete